MSIKERTFDSLYHPANRALQCTTQLKMFRHYTFPGLNLSHESNRDVTNISDTLDLYKKPSVMCSKPLPCLAAKYVENQGYPFEDKALKLVKKKFEWKKNKKRWKNLAQYSLKDKKVMKQISDCMNKNEPVSKLPFIIARLSDHLAKNPDEYFKGVYNWYYGNPMAVCTIDDDHCLLYTGGENMNKFCFSTFEIQSSLDFIPNVSPSISMSLDDDEPIFDIRPSRIHGPIGVRQRDNCYFFTYNRGQNEEIILNNCFRISKLDYPFVSMDVGEREFCLVNSNRELTFWIPDCMKECVDFIKLPEISDHLSNKFAQIKYSVEEGSQTFALIDRKKLYFYDKRTNCKSPSSIWDTQNITEMCEDLSLLLPSQIEKYWYLGMTHSCLLFDARKGFSQKWTHMLMQAPSIGFVQRVTEETCDRKEYLLLASQAINDNVAVYNEWKAEVPQSEVLPTAVPDRIDTLHDARCNGLLSDPELEKKFTYSLIGMAGYKRNKKIGVFSLISTGDIFHHSLIYSKSENTYTSPKNIFLSDTELNYLKKWEKECVTQLKKSRRTLVNTKMVDFSYVFENAKLNTEVPSWPQPYLSGAASWKRSKKKLESYCDFLTPFLMKDYGINEESEWGTESEEDDENSVLNESSSKKVVDWLSTFNPSKTYNEDDIEQLFNNESTTNEKTDDIVSVELSISSDETTGNISRHSRSSLIKR